MSSSISQTPSTCAFALLNGEEDPTIPSGMECVLGPNSYHIRNLVLALLSMPNLCDPFTKVPLEAVKIHELAMRIGISQKAFIEIWTGAEGRCDEKHLSPPRIQFDSSDSDSDDSDEVVLREPRLILPTAYATSKHTFLMNDRYNNLHAILKNEVGYTSAEPLLKKRQQFLAMLQASKLWQEKMAVDPVRESVEAVFQ